MTSRPTTKPVPNVTIRSSARDIFTEANRILVSTTSVFCRHTITAKIDRTTTAITFTLFMLDFMWLLSVILVAVGSHYLGGRSQNRERETHHLSQALNRGQYSHLASHL